MVLIDPHVAENNSQSFGQLFLLVSYSWREIKPRNGYDPVRIAIFG
jgi:hypothetical protein